MINAYISLELVASGFEMAEWYNFPESKLANLLVSQLNDAVVPAKYTQS